MDSIQKEFILLLEEIGKEKDFRCQRYESKGRRTSNIVELDGYLNCLLYFKIRSEEPYNWGVTKSRIEELQASGKKWFVILLFETPKDGYLLTSKDVEQYINEGLWPIGKNEKNKNEYKISKGKPLQNNHSFNTFEEFINSLINNMNNKTNQNPKSKLNSLLNKYDDFLKRKEEKREREKSERERFTEVFIKIRDGIIKPIFERIKVEIESRGHKVHIETKEPSWDTEKHLPIEPLISFNLQLFTKDEECRSRYNSTHDLPHLSFICDSPEMKIWSHESTIGSGHGGHTGARNKFTTEQVTEEVVENELMGWLENLMKDATPSYY